MPNEDSVKPKRPHRRHGFAGNGDKRNPLYPIWVGMRQRCLNPTNGAYYKYGGRGITVCDRWNNSFESFLADMGPRPKGKSLDRINNDGPYSPENCRWATPLEQALNTRPRGLMLTLNGETLSAVEWAGWLGFPWYLISHRLSKGWSVEDTLLRPWKRLKRKSILTLER